MREISENALAAKKKKEQEEFFNQVKNVMRFLRKKAAEGVFEAEYSGPLSEEACMHLQLGRDRLIITLKVAPPLAEQTTWLIKW